MNELIDILIVGNGFDASCGLPTNYSDFFKWRIQNNKSDYELLDSLFLDNKAIEGFSFKPVRNQDYYNTSYVSSYGSSAILTKGKLFNEFKLNLWDILFYVEFVIDNGESPLKHDDFGTKIKWSSVEDDIYRFVGKNSQSQNGMSSHRNKYPSYFNLKHGVAYAENDPKEMKLKFSFYARQYLLESYNLEEYSMLEKLIDYNIVLCELKKFEKTFASYLEIIIAVNREEYAEKTEKLMKEIFHNRMTKKVCYLNFNYTPIHCLLFESTTIHVHGRCDGETIFGIDSAGIDAKSESFKFTKTRRKMSASNNFKPSSIPDRTQVKSIRFFGHSLAKADYSYFKSIFDFYSIYSSDVELIFYYKTYDDKSSESLLNEQSDLVAQLLRNYGETLPNIHDGENLLHKLLLENRLQIKEIITE